MQYSELENGPYLLAYDNFSGFCVTEVFQDLEKAQEFRQALVDHCNVKRCKIFELVEVVHGLA